MAALALVAVLFWAGVYDESVFALLTNAWRNLLAALGATDQLTSIQQNVSGEVTKRSLPVVATYAVAYTGVCLLLLRLLVPAGRMRLVFLLYVAVLGCCAVLLVAGKLAGDVPWLYQLGRHLIDFIVSPLPVLVLVILLRWYVPAASSPNQEV
ncbi:XrtX-associated membrane protein [Hymenobacter sediminicola]|uniref:Uncharacterized protein n=1 Tax=Hymenobacter sediminicola TaxID=2761579 RepID=A0A7G7W8N4_9BACT|nr:hypothetical protein [Hymenobacter sediminicola]QNH62727.1 hypothetical protein H4317_02560 [Hymenobacter sediminicola]